MRAKLVAMLAAGGVLSACANAGSLNHRAMSCDETMRRCEMMDRSTGEHRQTAQDQSHHDPAQHGSMSHSEIERLCASMQGPEAPAAGAPSRQRLDEVAAAGAMVMPFDLERTTHVFADRTWGGEQVVVSDDNDANQIALIRAHLTAEAARFARGEFASSEQIHGHDMPGLDVLRARYAGLDVTYAERPGGASINYRASDQALVDAIHTWFAAQRSDHGAHAAH